MRIFDRPEYGALVLRLTLGIVLVAHSVYLKLVVFSLPGTAQFFDSIGLPAFLAYVVFAMEAVAGIGLILGWKSQWLASAIIPVLIGAMWAHVGNGWLFSNEGGGWEYPLVLIALAIAQVFLGDGAWSVSKSTRAAEGHSS